MNWFTIDNDNGTLDVKKSKFQPIPIGYKRIDSPHAGKFYITPHPDHVQPWVTEDGHEALFAMKEFEQRKINCVIDYEEMITDGSGADPIPFRHRRFETSKLLESFIKTYWITAEADQYRTYNNISDGIF